MVFLRYRQKFGCLMLQIMLECPVIHTDAKYDFLYRNKSDFSEIQGTCTVEYLNVADTRVTCFWILTLVRLFKTLT